MKQEQKPVERSLIHRVLQYVPFKRKPKATAPTENKPVPTDYDWAVLVEEFEIRSRVKQRATQPPAFLLEHSDCASCCWSPQLTVAMNNTASNSMPDLPGYYYDASRNRYFKGKKPRTPLPPRVQQNQVMNIARILRHDYEYGAALSRTHVTDHILSTCPHLACVNLFVLASMVHGYRIPLFEFVVEIPHDDLFQMATEQPFHFHDLGDPNVVHVPPIEIPLSNVLRSSIAVNDGRKVRLHGFPHGPGVASTYCDDLPVASKWSAKHSVLVFAILSGGTEEIVWLALPSLLRVFQRHSFKLMENVNQIDISDDGIVAVGCTFILQGREKGKFYVLNKQRTLFKSYVLDSAVLCVKFIDEDSIVLGTRSGLVEVRNFKENAPVYLRRPSKEGKLLPAVCCLRVEGRKV